MTNVLERIAHSFESHGDKNALWVNEKAYSYQTLQNYVAKVINEVPMPKSKSALCGILASRSLGTFVGVLSTLFSSKAYVPLNPDFPIQRLKTIVELSTLKLVYFDNQTYDLAMQLKELVSQDIEFAYLDEKGESEKYEGVKVNLNEELTTKKLDQFDIIPSDLAYLMFTSGSTGEPKGVPISHKNLESYVKYISETYQFSSQDKFSQTFDLSFDLSVHDMFVCWSTGACLYCLPKKYVMAPAKFIKDHELTVWFSVPSVLMFMSKMKMLKDKFYPSIRLSFFCGEALPKSLLSSWGASCVNSRLVNLYGPTEATIAFTEYEWDREEECGEIVSIGKPFTHLKVNVLDDQENWVLGQEAGELCLAGDQLSTGYWNNADKTKEAFFEKDGLTWYKTGDLAKINQSGEVDYLGRVDSQVKVLGHRIELQEIDNVLRKVCESEMSISVLVEDKKGQAYILGVTSAETPFDEQEIRTKCALKLPDYMIPKKIHKLSEFPLNVNGKIDRKKITAMISEL